MFTSPDLQRQSVVSGTSTKESVPAETKKSEKERTPEVNGHTDEDDVEEKVSNKVYPVSHLILLLFPCTFA